MWTTKVCFSPCRLQKAERLHNEGDPKQSVKKLTRAIALDPHNAALFKGRAEAHVSLQEYHSGVINFKKALSLSPSEREEIENRLATVHYLHGQALVAEEHYDRALEEFDLALNYHPSQKEYVMQKIDCLLSLQRYRESMEAIERELVADDTNPQLYFLRAKLHMLFGNVSLYHRSNF